MRIMLNTQGYSEKPSLKVISVAADTAFTRAIRQSTIEVEKEAVILCKVDTGHARLSITNRVIQQDKMVEGQVVATKEIAKYTRFLAKPFKAHWTSIRNLWLWIKNHTQAKLKHPFDEKLMASGMWVKSTDKSGKKGKRHFVPFDIAPGLARWAKAHGLEGKIDKALYVGKHQKPFAVPAVRKALPAIKIIMEKVTKESVKVSTK